MSKGNYTRLVSQLGELVLSLGIRGIGNTTTMRTGTDNNDCIVIAHNAEYARRLKGNYAIGLDELHKLRGMRKPVAIDHHALCKILAESGAAIHTLLAERDRLLIQVDELRAALESYATCQDGCTCGDGWSHETARAALAERGSK